MNEDELDAINRRVIEAADAEAERLEIELDGLYEIDFQIVCQIRPTGMLVETLQ